MRVDQEAVQLIDAADIAGIEVYTRGDARAEYNSSMGAACGSSSYGPGRGEGT